MLDEGVEEKEKKEEKGGGVEGGLEEEERIEGRGEKGKEEEFFL